MSKTNAAKVNGFATFQKMLKRLTGDLSKNNIAKDNGFTQCSSKVSLKDVTVDSL